MKPLEPELIDYLAHFSEGLSPEIQRYATYEVFKSSRYIFTTRIGKQQYGWCTHCLSEFKTNGLFRHNANVFCPECDSACTVKAGGLGRKSLVDAAYFVYYEKSVKDPKVIVARGIYAVRDYSRDYHLVQTLCLERTRYIFEIGKSVMLERHGFYSQANTMQHGEFSQRKTVHSISSQYESRERITFDYSRESIKEAVKNTPFSWSGWESYRFDGMVKFFDLYSKYPSIEYLTKLGFGDLVRAKLMGDSTYSAINWRGKTLLKVLKLTKKELNEIKSSKISVDPLFLKLLQLSKKDGSNLSLAEISVIRKTQFQLSDLQIMMKYTSLRKSFNYLTSQLEKQSKHFKSSYLTLTTWKDYIADCIMLEMNLTDERVLFPKNLYDAHQATTKRIKTHEDEILDSSIQRRLKDLESKYCFEHSGLLIRPSVSTKELIAEGKTLVHCVGNYGNGYMTKYAQGKINLLLIRKLSDPDTPYYTVELKKETVAQVYGYKNCLPNDDVRYFIKAFTDQKLKPKKTKERAKISVPA